MGTFARTSGGRALSRSWVCRGLRLCLPCTSNVRPFRCLSAASGQIVDPPPRVADMRQALHVRPCASSEVVTHQVAPQQVLEKPDTVTESPLSFLDYRVRDLGLSGHTLSWKVAVDLGHCWGDFFVGFHLADQGPAFLLLSKGSTRVVSGECRVVSGGVTVGTSMCCSPVGPFFHSTQCGVRVLHISIRSLLPGEGQLPPWGLDPSCAGIQRDDLRHRTLVEGTCGA